MLKKHRKLIPLLAALMLAFNFSASAQVDSNAFAPDSLQFVTDGEIHCLKKWQDTLYVGGYFQNIGRYTGSATAINANTGAALNYQSWPKANGSVYKAIPDGSGGVIIAGNFTMVGDQMRKNLAWINASGAVTSLNADINGSVYALMLNGGVLYVGGDFTTINGNTRNNIAAINIGSGALTAWNPNCNGIVKAFALDGTTVYAGGAFTQVSGSTTRYKIAAFDMTTGTVTSWNAGTINNEVRAIIVANNKVYTAGTYTTPSISPLVFDKTSGAIIPWVTTSSTVLDMVLVRNKIYMSGNFININSTSRPGLAAVDTATGSLAPWSPNVATGSKLCLSVVGSDVCIGANAVAWVVDSIGGTLKSTSNIGWNKTVYTVATVAGQPFIGGDFASAGMSSHSCVAAINLKTNSLHPMQIDVAPNMGSVRQIETDGTTLYLGGDFFEFTGTPSNPWRPYVASFNIATNYSITPLTVNYGNAVTPGLKSMQLSGNYLYIAMLPYYTFSNPPLALRINKTTNIVDSWNQLPYKTANQGATNIKIANNDMFVSGDIRNGTTWINSVKHSITAGTTTEYASFNGAAGMDIEGNKIYGIATATTSSLYLDGTAASPWPVTINGNGGFNALEVDKARIYLGGVSGAPYRITSMNGFARGNVGVVDTLGNLAGGWRPFVNGGVNGFLASGDTLFTFGNFTDVSGRKLQSLTRYHLNGYATPTVSVAAATTPICAGALTTFNATISLPVSGPIYQWKKNGVDVGTNSSSYSYNAVNGDQISCSVIIPGSSDNAYIVSKITSNIVTVTTVTGSPSTASISVSANNVCPATSVTLTATTNMTSPSYQWKKNGLPVGTNSSTYTYTAVNNDQVLCEISSTGCYSPAIPVSNTISMVVIPNTSATASISAGATTVCQGTAASFTATTNITAPAYQWMVNSVPTGTNSSTFNYTPANGDVVRCDVSPVSGCYTSVPRASNNITMTVNSNITLTAAISAGANNICAGTPVTFTATTSSSSTYQWRVNGLPVGTSSSTYNYTPANSDQVTCTITALSGCYTPASQISNTVTMNVTSPVTTTASVSASATNVCQGANVNFTATTSIISGASYQWKVNGNNVGTSVSTYNYAPANGDVVSCTIAPTTGCYTTTPVTSTPVTMTVNPYVTPTIFVAASANNICQGTSVTYTASTNVTSGASYQWKVNNVNVGTNSTTYTYVPAHNDVVHCVLTTSTGCYSPVSQISNFATMVVNAQVNTTATIFANATTVCQGSPATFFSSINALGGSYQWKVNNVNAGTNSNTFTYNPLNNDVVTCVITISGCYTTLVNTSNSITITTTPFITPNISVITSNTATCDGDAATFLATTNVPGGTYQWKVNGTNAGTNVFSFIYNAAVGDEVACELTMPAGCYTATSISDTVAANVVAKTTPTVGLTGTNSVPPGGTATITAAVSAGANIDYNWMKNGVFMITTAVPLLSYTKGTGIDTITVEVVSDGCFLPATSGAFFVQDPTGVEKIDAARISVYPNPFGNELRAKGISIGDKLELYDVVGRKTGHSFTITENKAEHIFSIKDVIPGSYILNIRDKNNNPVANFRLQKL